jgi:hypothetical protein
VPLTTKDLPGLAEPNPDAPLIYLDQWVWVELALAARSGSGVYADLLGALTEMRASRRIAVALTAANYLELGQRRSSRSRRDVAKVMAEVTGYATLAAIHSVQAEEVRRAASWVMTGANQPPAPLERHILLGVGANHAFASQTGRYRFVERIAGEGATEGPETGTPEPAGMARAKSSASGGGFTTPG